MSATQPAKPVNKSSSFLHPKNWLVALGLGLWWLIVQILPFSLQMYLGRQLGRMIYKSNVSRKRVAKKNIALCFPELNESEQQALLKKHLISVARGFFDTGIAWFWPYWRFKKRIEVIGLEHLIEAREQGNGVLFLGLHFTSMELTSPGINRRVSFPILAVYRAHDNPLFDRIQLDGRAKHNREFSLIPKQDVRGMVRCLKKNGVLAYLPDQDYGKKHSVFAPFFDVPTATVNGPSQLLRMTNAQKLIYYAVRNEDATGYKVHICPCPEGLNGADKLQDATLLNEVIEEQVRAYPDQYFWLHRRFKSRPDGEQGLYS